MVNDFVVFTNKVGVVPICWYIWIVITISYHKSFPFLVLKMGSPRIYCGAKTFNTEKSQVCGRTVLPYKHTKQIRRIPRMIRREAGTENSLVKDIRILLRYQHDDKVAGSRSFSLCKQLKEALWSCVMRILEDRSGR